MKQTAPKLSKLLNILPIFSFLFAIYWGLFYFFYEQIHNFYPPVDLDTILFYARFLIEKDGVEIPVMLFGSILYLLIGWFFISRADKLKILHNRLILILASIPGLFILFQIKTGIFIPAGFFEAGLLFVVVCIWLYLSLRLVNSRIYFKILWLIFGAVVLLGLETPEIYDYDYDYILGPALKLLQGEQLGSFFMQYSLLGTLLFAWFVELKLSIYQMQFILGMTLIFWYLLYFKLGSVLIKDNKLRVLFIISLILVRYFSNMSDPTTLPQVLPFRLDLWVPLVLIVYRFGFLSLITSTAFSFVYILDNTFGLFHLVVYLFMVSLHIKFKLSKQLLFLFIPVALAVVFNLYFFKSITNPANSYYHNAQLGFLPIDSGSLFWLIFALLPVFLFIFNMEKVQKLKLINIFILGLALMQFIYFYGRSHDHNLLNISGVIITLLFLALDGLSRNFKIKKAALWIAIFFILTVNYLSSGFIFDKLERVKLHIFTGQIFTRHDSITWLENNVGMFLIYPRSTNILVMGNIDSYVNYLNGLKQIGTIVPFSLNIYVKQTIDLLVNEAKKGTKIVFFEKVYEKLIEQLNESGQMRESGYKFVIISRGKFKEVLLLKR